MIFETQHDAVRLGKLTALDDDGQPLSLASLADLVRYTMGGDSASGLPLKAAAAAVLDKIQSAEPLPVIYATQPNTFANAVPLDHLVRRGRPATQHHVTYHRPRGYLPGGWQAQPSAGHGLRAVVVPEQSAVIELRGPAGCLEWLREVWTKNPKGDALLSHPQCARYAMRLDLAHALFDFGLELKEAVPVAHVVSPADTATQAAAGAGFQPLAGLPKHDTKRWGAPHSAEQPPRKLVRLADVVRMICGRCRVESPQYCAGLSLERLGAASLPRLFKLQLGPLAVAIADDHLWRERFASGADTLAKHDYDNRTSSLVLLRPCLKTGEAEARRLNQDPGLYFYGVSDADMQLWPELPELRGPAGALELMRQQWGQQAQTFDDLDTGPLASVAILDADAVRLAVLLFGAPSPVSRASPASAAVVTAPETAPVPAPPVSDSFLRDPVQPAALTLVSIAPAMPVRDAQARKDLEAKARAEFKRAKDPADLWGAQHFAELLRQFNLLTAKVPGRLNVQPAHDLLSEIWGIAPASVKTYLTKARAQPQHAEGLAAG